MRQERRALREGPVDSARVDVSSSIAGRTVAGGLVIGGRPLFGAGPGRHGLVRDGPVAEHEDHGGEQERERNRQAFEHLEKNLRSDATIIMHSAPILKRAPRPDGSGPAGVEPAARTRYTV